MKAKWRRIFIGAIIGALMIGGLVYVFLPEPIPVDLAEVTRGNLRVTVDEEGRTRVKELYVVSAPLAGRALRIRSKVGDIVTAGKTLLATIEETHPSFLNRRSKTEAQAAVKAAEAAKVLAESEVAKAQAELNFARAELDRARALYKDNTISKSVFDRADLDFNSHRAALEVAKAALLVKTHELETARAALIEPTSQDTRNPEIPTCCIEVRAPVSGRVLKILHESEGVVSAGQPLIEIGDPKDLEIVVELLSVDAVKIKEGAAVIIEEWGGGKELNGRVRRIEPYGFTKVSALGIEEQRVNVIIDFTDPPDKWRPLGHGFRVETRILVLEEQNVLKLPLGALFREGKDWAVFVYAEGTARLRRVKIGHRNTLEAQALNNIQEDERVILHPSDRIKDGVKVVPRPTN